MKQLSIILLACCLGLFGFAQPSPGAKAPEIALPDVNGATINLSSFRGKVVLLDFWASWCGPCRNSNRRMVPVYKKYKPAGFEIFSVSVDANQNAWKRAIAQDRMTWPHVIDVGAENGNELTRNWRIAYIPTTYLLDREGRIVAMNPEKAELESLLKKLL